MAFKYNKKLLCFTVSNLDEMVEKGNVWYVSHYETYFDEVYVVYLMGGKRRVIQKGRTYLISLSRGRNNIVNLFLAPFRLLMFSKKVKPTSYLTADMVFSWWTSILVRFLIKAEIILMPVCMPHVIYRSLGKTFSGLPLCLEKLFLKLSFKTCARVLSSRAFGGFVEWLSNKPEAANKLEVVDLLVDALPSPDFFKKIYPRSSVKESFASSPFTLLYVGRLHEEKFVDQLIQMTKIISRELSEQLSWPVQMILIGDGPERQKLERLADELGIKECIKFVGYLPNDQIADYYYKADVFVSPLTGTSLREAALFGLPIVAYGMDWVVNVFQHDENILFAKYGNPEDMAQKVMLLFKEPGLRLRIGQNAKELAWKLWGVENLQENLARIFD